VSRVEVHIHVNGLKLCLITAAINRHVIRPLDDIYEYGETWWNDIDRGKPKNSERNLFQCHFFHHESDMTDPGLHGQ
jgi:hypothetical protein